MRVRAVLAQLQKHMMCELTHMVQEHGQIDKKKKKSSSFPA